MFVPYEVANHYEEGNTEAKDEFRECHRLKATFLTILGSVVLLGIVWRTVHVSYKDTVTE